jgi:Lrp/AsnC family transcriptional regulator, leucine-responsive regulatory protein
VNNARAQLDGYDQKILRILSDDGRISWSDLADKVGLSMTPTIRRVRRMEAAGLIERYAAKLNEELLVGSMNAFVSVTLESQMEKVLIKFESEIAKSPNVLSCFLMTGGADYLIRVVVRDLNDYEKFVTKTLSRIPGVARIRTSFALRPVIQRSALLP